MWLGRPSSDPQGCQKAQGTEVRGWAGLFIGAFGAVVAPHKQVGVPGLASHVGHTARTNSHKSHAQPHGPHPAQFTRSPYGRTSQTQALGSRVATVTHAVASSVVPS